MYTDAHCHPYDLFNVLAQAEDGRRRLGVLAAASACNNEEFEYNEKLAKAAAGENSALLFLCFAIHPQQVAVWQEEKRAKPVIEPQSGSALAMCGPPAEKADVLLAMLEKLAAQGRIAAVGECGFDLYNEKFKETEALQDKIFTAHLEIALRHDLPIVLHVRRAMHKVFSLSKELARCKAVVFHSWPGTYDEGLSLLRRGVNAYFSFGCPIINEHNKAIKSCALFPATRLLTETDAPYQPARGETFSHWGNLPLIVKKIANLRSEALGRQVSEEAMESVIESNFRKVF